MVGNQSGSPWGQIAIYETPTAQNVESAGPALILHPNDDVVAATFVAFTSSHMFCSFHKSNGLTASSTRGVHDNCGLSNHLLPSFEYCGYFQASGSDMLNVPLHTLSLSAG